MTTLAQYEAIGNYLITAIGTLCAVIGILFWQLITAKNDLSNAYKEILPIATLLNQTVNTLQKLIDKFEERHETP